MEARTNAIECIDNQYEWYVFQDVFFCRTEFTNEISVRKKGRPQISSRNPAVPIPIL